MTTRNFVQARSYTPCDLVPQVAAWGYRPRKITSITIHHWGDRGQTHDGVVAWFRDSAPTSAHYVVSAGRITQMVRDEDAAWHAGSAEGNATSIGIECRPEATDADYTTVAELIRDLRATHGPLPLVPHRQWYTTSCPGVWDLARLNRLSGGSTMKPYSPAALAIVRAVMHEAKGQHLDPDASYGYQCADVIDWAAQRLTGVPWQKCVGGVNGAKDLPNVAPAEFWEWQANIIGDDSVVPPEGSFVILDATPGNEYGHVAWVGTATADRIWVLEQNSNGRADLPLGESEFDYLGQEGYGPVLGWLKLREENIVALRPKAPAQNLAAQGGKALWEFSARGATVRDEPTKAGKALQAYPAKPGQRATVTGCRITRNKTGKIVDVWYRLAHQYNGLTGWVQRADFVWNSVAGIPEV